jgi:hypothetical protein
VTGLNGLRAGGNDSMRSRLPNGGCMGGTSIKRHYTIPSHAATARLMMNNIEVKCFVIVVFEATR